MRAHQPGSTPIDIPETVPNPAHTPAPAPERTPTKAPEKVPEKISAARMPQLLSDPAQYNMFRRLPDWDISRDRFGAIHSAASSEPKMRTRLKSLRAPNPARFGTMYRLCELANEAFGRSCMKWEGLAVDLSVPKTSSALISRENRPTSADHVLAVLLRPACFGLGV